MEWGKESQKTVVIHLNGLKLKIFYLIIHNFCSFRGKDLLSIIKTFFYVILWLELKIIRMEQH